ncbi:pyridoxal phosphate-dependent aminotransferase [Thermophagus sp. OGC60D27]|uniref:pyridoxal phosphate-dependent aminotransferase n=1 Tax=Thermophagus sp. OGC60D27 TaxID=3458415 RepID=UPI004037B987
MSPKNPFPISKEVITQLCNEYGITSLSYSTIRQIVQLVNRLEDLHDVKFIRTEMGVPGLKTPELGVLAEKEGLDHGISAVYPPIEGMKELKVELSRFARLFLDIELSPEGCIPTVGSMQASYVTFMVASRCHPQKNTTLFIDPGFPVHKRQLVLQGIPYESFDIYNFRGDKLRHKLESHLKKGNISTILYSNPNNPSWICFTEKELSIIGEMANKYDVIVMEDLAYFGMDFRKHYGTPGVPPSQPTVAKYTDNYVLLFSSSKIFSYAGQRIGGLMISDKLFERRYEGLLPLFNSERFGIALLQGALYATTAGTSYSAQWGLAALLKSVNDGKYDFISHIKEYGDRATGMKKLFEKNGFKLVYSKDEDQPLADGFYFTIYFPGLTGEELLFELIRYGISAITLATTGSTRTEGLRICVSQTGKERMNDLAIRLKLFSGSRSLHS